MFDLLAHLSDLWSEVWIHIYLVYFSCYCICVYLIWRGPMKGVCCRGTQRFGGNSGDQNLKRVKETWEKYSYPYIIPPPHCLLFLRYIVPMKIAKKIKSLPRRMHACTHFYSPKTFSYYKVNVNDISVTDQNDCEHWSKLVLVMFLSIWRLKQILSLWLTRIHDAAVSEQTTAMISLSLLRDNVSSIL